MTKIILKAGEIELKITLNESPTNEKILEALPITNKANRWGEEVYFEVPVKADREDNASDVMEIGEVGFWTGGSCIAIFFGPTPASKENEPRAVEPINRVGFIEGDVMLLKNVKDGDEITLDKE